MSDPCDLCHRGADTLIAVQTLEATFWSPSENQLLCPMCVQQAQDRAEQDEERRSLKDYTDAERERI